MSSPVFPTEVRHRTWLRVGVVSLVVLGLLLTRLAPRTPVAAIGRPQGGTIELCGGQCVHRTITYETGDLRIDRVDVVFLLDVSGSMGGELGEVQDRSIEIMENLRDLVPDSAFGVASFVDYNDFTDSEYGRVYGSEDDYPYRLDQDITESLEAVRTALDALTLEYGEDQPEAYSRALWEMQFLNWRDDSKRIVILFGDAFPHDRTFFDRDYGVDPGRDEIQDTEDDLVFVDVVQDLVDAHIAVIGVNSEYERDNAVLFFEYVSEQTGGLYFPLSDSDEIADAVAQLVEEEISTIDRLTLRVPDGYSDWVTYTPAEYTDVGSYETLVFEVDICPVAGRASAGSYQFDLVVDGDGTAVETLPISIDYVSRCTTGPEVYIADQDDDDGSVCTEGPFWQSPGIVVRHRDDGLRIHQNPIRGETNYIYAEVRNIGDEDATDVQVTLYWANAAIGLWWPDQWNQIGSTTVDVPVGGSVWTEGIAWDPPGEPGEGHFCLLARIESDEDPITREGDVPCDNNIAQRNLQILDLGPGEGKGTDEAIFRIIAPPEDLMGVIDLVVSIPWVPPGTRVWIALPIDLFERWQRAGGLLEGGSIEGERILADPDAAETVIRDLPLEPGEEAEATLYIEAPIDKDTEYFSLTVAERVDGRDVGGSTYYYAPPELPAFLQLLMQFWNTLVDNPLLAMALLCCGGVLLVAVVVAVVVLLRRRGRQRAPAQAAPYGGVCAACGSPLPAGVSFCPQCGSPVVETAPPATGRVCPNCGAVAREGARFCANCGVSLEG